MTLGRFFNFREFYEKRNEFIKSVDKETFFNSEEQRKCYMLVELWIGKRLDLTKASVKDDNVTYGTIKIKMNKTCDCSSFLKLLKLEDAIGVVCLYEMISRQLKPDIPDVAATLHTDYVDWTTDVIKVPQSGVLNLPIGEGKVDTDADLRNVLIMNVGLNGSQATVKAQETTIELKPRECCRAIFSGTECVGLLPCKVRQGNEEYNLKISEDGRAALHHNGVGVVESGSIVSYSVNPRHPRRYVYATDSGRIISADTSIDDFTIRSSLSKRERPIHIIIGLAGELYILTAGKQLYMYTNSKGFERVETKGDVAMIGTNNNGNLTIKLISEIVK